MSNVVIDTNVWIMAHVPVSQQPAHRLRCANTCRKWLTNLRDGERTVAVDHKNLILGKYWSYLEQTRPPGAPSLAGEILREFQSTGRINVVQIPLTEEGEPYLAPELNLQDFDRADWKFVAVALACDDNPPIVNATDTDWQQHIEALNAAGIIVEELCPDLVG
jgi:hypothetical protein